MGARLERSVDVEDILQETLLKGFRAIETFEWRDEESFAHWLGVIAENSIKYAERPLKNGPPVPLPADLQAEDVSRGTNLRRDERFDRLQGALDQLDADSRKVVVLARIEGLPIKEVARRIGDAYGTAAPGILMLSSAGQLLAPAEASDLGIARVLLKPLKQSDLLDAITSHLGTATRDKQGPGQDSDATSRAVEPMKLLLAEDGKVNQMVTIKLLEQRGHSVVLAEDGQIAVDLHEKQSFDAILMDVQMPSLDGYDASKIIREREEQTGQHIPIIAMTANAMKGDRETCLEAGMDDYVSKPVRSAELYSVVEKYAPDAGQQA